MTNLHVPLPTDTSVATSLRLSEEWMGLPVEVSAALAGGVLAASITLIAVVLTNRHTSKLSQTEIKEAEKRWAGERDRERRARQADALSDAATRLLDTATEYLHALVGARTSVEELHLAEWTNLGQRRADSEQLAIRLDNEFRDLEEQLAPLRARRSAVPAEKANRQKRAKEERESALRSTSEIDSRRKVLEATAYELVRERVAPARQSWQAAVQRSLLLAQGLEAVVDEVDLGLHRAEDAAPKFDASDDFMSNLAHARSATAGLTNAAREAISRLLD